MTSSLAKQKYSSDTQCMQALPRVQITVTWLQTKINYQHTILQQKHFIFFYFKQFSGILTTPYYYEFLPDCNIDCNCAITMKCSSPTYLKIALRIHVLIEDSD